MSIKVLYEKGIKRGGGMIFCRALNHKLKAIQLDEKTVIVNGHECLLTATLMKLFCPNIKMIHRIDGPFSHYKIDGTSHDKLLRQFTLDVCDGAIFQSKWTSIWSPAVHDNLPCAYINNGTQIESATHKIQNNYTHKKLKVFYFSNSPNWLKGFDILTELDRNDELFSHIELQYFGPKPESVKFKNITISPRFDHTYIDDIMEQFDLFIFLSKYESCSNALIEACVKGMPLLVRDSGSNSEIVNKQKIILFDSIDELVRKLKEISINPKKLTQYRMNEPDKFNLESVVNNYLKFADSCKASWKPRICIFLPKLVIFKLCAFYKKIWRAVFKSV